MLKRIYVDNYKSLVNFEVSLDEINLFLGVNGAGKSAVFEILRKIKCLVAGDGKVIELFAFDNCTRWQSSLLQTFELDIAGNGGRSSFIAGSLYRTTADYVAGRIFACVHL